MEASLKSAPVDTAMTSTVLLYNTQNVDVRVLKAGFSIRQKEYQRLWRDIESGTMHRPETHYLIQGVRGSGKTTLLSRLAHEVAEDKKLKKWLIPILLNEEEYGILSLFTFWLRISEKLAEQLPQNYSELFEQIERLNEDAQAAWELIREYLDSHQQKIIVFVDNLGELFKDFSEIEQAQLREVLSLHPQIRLIGGSSEILDAHFDGNAPFYQFFKLITLHPVSEEEMHKLLRSLARQTGKEAVQNIEEIITRHPERIEAVRRLTDGVPRTIVLLFQIIMEGAKDSSYAYLEETIDKTTPLYKHRMDDLPKQQRAIVHTIAMNWDAMSAKEIAEQTRLPSKTVSAQLVKLQKQWIVDKIETNTKNHLYIIKERFFNIWYLMRYGSKNDRRRVLWLTRFLESWYNKDELNIKLVEVAMPFLKAKKGINETSDTNSVYINALLASRFIDEGIKSGVNNCLKPFYKDLIDIDTQKIVFQELKKSINYINNQQYSQAKNTIVDLLEKEVGINDCLICWEFAYRNFKDESFLKEKILNKVFKISSYSFINQTILLLSIISTDYESSKIIGRALVSLIDEIKDIDMKVNISLHVSIFKAFIYLWFDDFDQLMKVLENLRKTGLYFKDDPIEIDFFEQFLLLLIKKDQLEIVYKLMKDYVHLQVIFKPLYYATVSLLQDERRQEYLRMGPELQGIVDEILAKVEEYRIKYV